MIRKSPIAITLAGSLLACLPEVALAQKDKPQLVSMPTISIQFGGGNLADYVKTLREAATNFNIVLAVPEAKDIRLPAIKLDSVSFYPALRVLQGDYPMDDGSIVQILVNDLGGPRDGEAASPVYRVWSERKETRKPNSQVRVWNIGALLTTEKNAEAILTAVESAVGLLSGYAKAEIRYHAETNLLIASGEEEQLRAIERVVESLRPGRPGKGRAEATSEKLDELIARLKQSSEGAQANVSLQQASGNKDAELAELLALLQQEIQEKDRIIRQLRQNAPAREKQ